MPVYVIPFIIIGAIFVVIFAFSINGAIKGSKNQKELIDEIEEEDALDNILSNNIFDNKQKEEQECFCEYCGTVLPVGIRKCPNCSANLKKKKISN